MGKLTDFLKYANEIGLPVPLARDPVIKQPSVTMFFLFVSNTLAIISLIYLHFKAEAFIATCMTLLYAVISTVLYMMRKLQSAKFDLDDKSFELDAGDEEKNT